MTRKILILASALLVSAPALAEPPQTRTQTAQERLLVLDGVVVRSSDGVELGQLDSSFHSRNEGEELTIRSPDGRVRAVPAAGARKDDVGLMVNLTAAQFRAIPAMEPQAAVLMPEMADEPPID